MKKNSRLSENMENYLETILALEKVNKVARAKDIAEKLGVQRGSVTGALKRLEEMGLINYEPYSYITLSPKGMRIARDISVRHTGLKDFLHKVLQVDEETADETACKMEHAIDPVSMDKLMCFIDYVHNCPRAGQDWLKSFNEYCSSKDLEMKKCDQCISNCQKAHQESRP